MKTGATDAVRVLRRVRDGRKKSFAGEWEIHSVADNNHIY